MKIVYDIASFLWTYVIAYALLGMGLYYTIRLGVPQIRYFKRTIIAMKNNIKSNDKIDEIQDLKGRQYNDKYQFGAIVDEKLENRNV